MEIIKIPSTPHIMFYNEQNGVSLGANGIDTEMMLLIRSRKSI